MGTSASGKGRSNKSPLVPDHADANPEEPLPEPEGQRFRGFRREFGKAVEGGGAGSFTTALGRYARDATGGAAIGPRRFGPAYVAGGALVGLLNDLRQGGTGEDSTGFDLSSLVGGPIGEAIERIAQALAPANADSDLVRISVQEALEEVFPDLDAFDPTELTADDLVSLLVEFFSRFIFLDITNDAGGAWEKAPTEQRTIDAENQFFDIVRASVDNHLSPALAGDIQNLTRKEVEAIERRAIDDIWSEWEGYE